MPLSTPLTIGQFFLKGTLLFQLQKDYELLERHIEDVHTKHSYHLKHVLPELKTKREALREKYKLCMQHSELEGRIKDMKYKLIWAQIEVQEQVFCLCHTISDNCEIHRTLR